MFGKNQVNLLEKESNSYCVPEEGGGGSECSANELIFESARGDRKAEKTLNSLAYGEISSTKHLISGGSEVFILTIKNKGKSSKAIFKMCHHSVTGVDGELAAVVFSRSIGFNITPLGLLRTISIEGREYTGYIQEWIPGKSFAQVSEPENLLESDKYYKQHNLIVLFDHLINNWDRGSVGTHLKNKGNFLLGDDKKLYAIDHSHASFGPKDNFYEKKNYKRFTNPTSRSTSNC